MQNRQIRIAALMAPRSHARRRTAPSPSLECAALCLVNLGSFDALHGRQALAAKSTRRAPNFTGSSHPNELWVAHLAHLRCWEALVFVAFVLDGFSRMIVGWQLADHMRTDLVLDALKMALLRRGPSADLELIHHSDRGSVLRLALYVSPASWASRAICTRLLSSSFSSTRETCAFTVATLM